MKAPEIFGLIVRLLGLFFFYRAIEILPMLAGMNSPLPIFYIGMHFVLAWWLIGGAKQLTQRAYPEPKPATPPVEKTNEKTGN